MASRSRGCTALNPNRSRGVLGAPNSSPSPRKGSAFILRCGYATPMWRRWPRAAAPAAAGIIAFCLIAYGALVDFQASFQPPTPAAKASALAAPFHPGPYNIFNFKNADSPAIDPKTGYVFVANEGFGRITVYDPARSQVVRFIEGVAGAMIFDPATGELVVLQGDAAVFVNATSGEILGSAPGLAPNGWRRPVLALDPADDFVYAAYNFQDSGSIWLGSTIQVLSVPHRSLIASLSGLWFTQGIAYDPANGRIYVDDVLGGLAAIDARTSSLVGYAKGIMDGPNGIAYNPVTQTLYVACFNGRIVPGKSGWQWTASVALVDPSSLALVGNVTSFHAGYDGPQYIAFDPHGDQMYLANGTGIFAFDLGGVTWGVSGLDDPGPLAVDSLTGSVYATENDALLQLTPDNRSWRVSGNGFEEPFAIAFDGTRDRMYVSNRMGSEVVVIDGKTDRIVGTIRGFDNSAGLAYDPQLDRLFVGNEAYTFCCPNYSVSAVDLATGRMVGKITGIDPLDLFYDNRTRDVIAWTSSGLTAFSAETLAPVANLTSSQVQGVVAFDPDQERLYVASGPNLFTINADDLTILTNVSLPHIWITCLGYDPVNGDLYAGMWSNGTAVLDPTTGRLLATIRGPWEPQDVLFNPANGYVYISDQGPYGQMWVIDPGTNQVIQNWELPDEGQRMAYNPVNEEVYVSVGMNGMGGGLVVAVPSVTYPQPSLMSSLANPWVSGVLVLGALTGVAVFLAERRRGRRRPPTEASR